MKLASAGDDIKIWDCSGYSLIRQFNPHDQNINSVQWNSDNNFLASVSENADKIALAHIKNTSVYTFAELNCGIGVKCLDFNSYSRYLLSGGCNKVVTLWDLKSKKIKKSYKDHKAAVTCACFNWNDTYIASGSESGEIIVYNVVTGQGTSPLLAPKVQAVRQLQYSKNKKSMLGSVSDDGAVNLWDTNTRRIVHNFNNGHIAPATGLNFSPINEILLISVGLDKRIVCYDLHSKKPVKTMTVESPLTSLDMKSDGATLAVGSTRGKIYIYDLRQGNSPVNMINAHKSSVQCLAFQSTAVIDSSGGISAISPPSVIHRQLPNSPGNFVRSESSPESAAMTPKQRDTLPVPEGPDTEDVFSPIHSGFTEHVEAYPSDSFGHYNSSLKQEDSYSGVFSPVGDSSLGKTSGVGMNNTGFFNHISEPIKDSLYGAPVKLDYNNLSGSKNVQVSTETNSESINAVHSEHSECEPSVASEHIVVDSPFPATVTVFDQSESLSATHNDKSPKLPNSRSSSRRSHYDMQSGVLSHMSTTTISPNAKTVNKTDTDVANAGGDTNPSHHYCVPAGASASVASAITPLGTESAQAFQTEFIRNLINEAIEDFRDEIHRDMLNLHVEMLRQFQIQMTEVRSLSQYYSLNENLIAEVEKLKEENKQLKKNF